MQRRNKEAYDMYRVKREAAKQMVRKAKREADVKWGKIILKVIKRCFGRK